MLPSLPFKAVTKISMSGAPQWPVLGLAHFYIFVGDMDSGIDKMKLHGADDKVEGRDAI